MNEKNEPKYETLTLGQALDAVASGEEVEFRAIDSTLSWYCLAKDNTWTARQSGKYTFRRLIQPKKKLAPFTKETWPIGAWIRLSNGRILMPTNITNKYVNGYSYESLLCRAKLLVIENGRVVGEKPCGLEVEE